MCDAFWRLSLWVKDLRQRTLCVNDRHVSGVLGREIANRSVGRAWQTSLVFGPIKKRREGILALFYFVL
jgi:hypothetical protein